MSSRSFTLNPQLFNPTLYSRLLKLWFADLPTSACNPAKEQVSRWFGVGASPEAKSGFDGECTSTALPALQSIAADKYPLPPWKDAGQDHQNYPQIAEPFVGEFATEKAGLSSEEAALGLVLLLDQMPRNIFRSRQDVIYTHYDRISRAVAYAVYAKGLDQSSRFRDSPPWQAWFYLPLMHSEALSDHRLMDQKIEAMQARMKQNNDPSAMEYANSLMAFEKKHCDILERFGRYPHRNRELGRESTREERKWLEDGGDTFGTS
ncbi:MAG: hypothetical protein LQ338_005427 [Usnochroma carphineum]|nr:MAG: hypothetical protein LQ338_005427 [Usnochroma carphineum]